MSQFRSLFIFIFTFIVASCSGLSDKNSVTISHAGTAEIEVNENVSFRISGLIPDSIINSNWHNNDLLQFDPPLLGKMRWQSKTQIEFVAQDSIPEATQFSIEINPDYFPKGVVVSKGQQTMSVHSPYFQLKECRYQWRLNNRHEKVLLATVNFNNKATVSDLLNQLHLFVDDREVQINGLEKNGPRQFQFEITPPLKAQKIKLKIDPGLQFSYTNWELDKAIEQLQFIPKLDALNIVNQDTYYDGSNGTVTFYFNQEMKEDNVKREISITPKIKFDVSVYDEKIIIESDEFDANTKYDIRFNKSVSSTLDIQLKNNVEQTVTFGEIQPLLEWENSKGLYVNALGNRTIGAKIIGIEEVEYKVYKIFSNNIVLNVRNGYRNGLELWNSVEEIGELVHEEIINVKALKRKGESKFITLDFKDSYADFKGIYFIQLESNSDRYWKRIEQFISLSDIGIICKESQNEVLIFTNSIDSSKPIGQVQVQLINHTNQVLGTVTTNIEGVAKWRKSESAYLDFNLAMIVAEKGNDYNMLKLNQGLVARSRFESGGKRSNKSGFETYLFGDRDLYRPGEAINVGGIIRYNSDNNAVSKFPFILECSLPNGRVFESKKIITDKYGHFNDSIPISNSGVTGRYLVKLKTNSNTHLESRTVLVEEFVPDRISVTSALNQKEYLLKDTLIQSISAMNLFGTPAINRKLEIQLELRKGYLKFDNYLDYNFNLNYSENFSNSFHSGTTDSLGEFQFQYVLPKEYENLGKIKVNSITTVFDETGRPVNRTNSAEFSTQKQYVGIENFYSYVNIEDPFQLPMVLLNERGEPIRGEVEISFYKKEYKTIIEQSSGGRYYYKSQYEDVLLDNSTVTIDGNYEFTYQVPHSGRYFIKVKPKNTKYFVEKNFWAYGYGRTSSSSFAVNREGSIEISTDKETYKVGDQAEILFQTPYNGTLLVSVERDEVLQYFTLETKHNSAAVSVALLEDFFPNIYVNAILIQPHEQHELPLTVAYGCKPLMIFNEKKVIAVEINAPEKVRSSRTQKITVKANPNTPVVLAAVDEGILQMTGMKSPDPFANFYAKQALAVETFDIYKDLLPEIDLDYLTGGGEYNLEKRVNPLTSKRVQLMTYWSGWGKTNSSGIAEFDIDIPQFSGNIRLMAVASNNGNYGAHESHILVVDPVILSSSIPRYLAPGDMIDLATTVTNTTDESMNVNIQVRVNDELVFNGNEQKREIGAHKEEFVSLGTVSAASIGVSKIEIIADNGHEKFIENVEIAIRPATSLTKYFELTSIQAGDTVSYFPKEKYIPSSVAGEITLSQSPTLLLQRNFNYLYRYPHGCTEQTISAAFPQLYLSSFLKDIQSPMTQKDIINNISVAINKVQSRQLPDGSVSYWSHHYHNWWTSIYALHFLIEAKQAGYRVNDKVIQRLSDFIQERVKKKEFFNAKMDHQLKPLRVVREIPYSLYVLSLVGKAPISIMNHHKENLKDLTFDGKYLLAGAFGNIGKLNTMHEILSLNIEKGFSEIETGNSFSSPLRELSIALMATYNADPAHQEIHVLMDDLIERLNAQKWLNTQESAFSLLALGKILKDDADANNIAQIVLDGNVIRKFTGGVASVKIPYYPEGISIETDGNGKLYSYIEVEGIPIEMPKEKDERIMVRRNILDREGNKVNVNNIRINDLIVIEINLKSKTGIVENIVITDLLPAGLEVENARVTEIPGLDWVSDSSTPQHIDIRDDRVLIYDEAIAGTGKTYYFVTRAVTKGTYFYGPVMADCMYNARYSSIYGNEKITIK